MKRIKLENGWYKDERIVAALAAENGDADERTLQPCEVHAAWQHLKCCIPGTDNAEVSIDKGVAALQYEDGASDWETTEARLERINGVWYFTGADRVDNSCTNWGLWMECAVEHPEDLPMSGLIHNWHGLRLMWRTT